MPECIGWPGHAGNVPDPSIRSLDDLVDHVVARITRPCAVLAQSMGGVVAMQAALRCPDRVTHLVLAATSGGIDIADLRPVDWREDFIRENPGIPRWFIDDTTDLTARIGAIVCPTLLLWGDADAISPVAVGERLHRLLPMSRLRVFAGAGHDLIRTHARDVAAEIAAHLGRAG